MKLEKAFSRILDIESEDIIDTLTWNSINFWPLVRQCIWLELTSATVTQEKTSLSISTDIIQQKILNRLNAVSKAIGSSPSSIGSESTAFISRPVYLQKLPNGNCIDRIVDPLIFCLPEDTIYSKYYITAWPRGVALNYPASLLRKTRFLLLPQGIPQEHHSLLNRLANDLGIESKRLLYRYEKNFKTFQKWLHFSRKFFDSRKNLKTVYFPSWYFPDMMALNVAARERGIITVEVQHGKQGKYQAMYSGWRIPEEGYQMMPDVFWTWGKPSAEHILAGDPNRGKHRPIIGGYPWLDYYRQFIWNETTASSKAKLKRVLITLQSPQADNNQPIPEFILDFLRERKNDVYFIFRCHPNDQNGVEYCQRRLSEMPRYLYNIDDGRSNLYDQLMRVSHHITAYSSCCYEAATFGVPTLLFGADARAIYSDEIESGVFSWTNDETSKLISWLESTNASKHMNASGYITSSLNETANILQRVELGNLDFYDS